VPKTEVIPEDAKVSKLSRFKNLGKKALAVLGILGSVTDPAELLAEVGFGQKEINEQRELMEKQLPEQTGEIIDPKDLLDHKLVQGKDEPYQTEWANIPDEADEELKEPTLGDKKIEEFYELQEQRAEARERNEEPDALELELDEMSQLSPV
jgi:hypothetical protein